MDVRLLGPLEVADLGGALVALGGPKAGVVGGVGGAQTRWCRRTGWSTRCGGDDAPRTAARTLQAYLSRLRKLLEPGVLESTGRGWVLRAGPGFTRSTCRGSTGWWCRGGRLPPG